VASVAQRLYLLEEACNDLSEGSPKDAYVRVQAAPASPGAKDKCGIFAGELFEMYQLWAKKRGMQARILRAYLGDHADRGGFTMGVSGLGALSILKKEHGLHVLELPGTDGRFERVGVWVRVTEQPDVPENRTEEMLAGADEAFGKERELPKNVVRRYRREPSPLVRDSVRGWRSGRFERVLQGDFDLF
jgi:ATP-dependent Clp protease ATP-binding subunit ClpC